VVKLNMYSVNNEYFNNINTELQAYVLAWFWSRGSGHIQVHYRDIETLYLIQNAIKYTGNIHTHKNTSELNIPYFSPHLLNTGCVRNCHYTQLLPSISDQLLPHFIRGIFDSYGTIVIAKQKYLNITIVYDERFITQLREFLHNVLRVSTRHYYRYSHTNTLQMMITRTAHTVRFLDWLYQDANYYLTRKFQMYHQYLENGV